MSPPTHPSSIPPATRVSSTPNGRNVSVVSPRPSSARLPVPGLSRQENDPEQHDRDHCPRPALEDALGDERAPDEGERRAHELHDFNFVTPGIGGEADDVGHRQRRGDREQRDDDQADRAHESDRRAETAQPAPVVAHVGHARFRAQSRGELVDGRRGGPRVGLRAAPRARPAAGLRSSRSVAPARSGKSSRNRASASAFDRYCRWSDRPLCSTSASSACTCSRRRVVLEVDRHLGRFAPAADDALEVGVHHQEEAEHEEPGGDGRGWPARADRQLAPAGSRPLRSTKYFSARMRSQLISTMWPWSSVSARRPTRRISSRSWVATTTVVPAGVDLAEEVHDLERQVGIEVAGGLVGQDDGRIVDERPRDRDALLLAARQLHRKRVHAVLQADPLEHLERPALLLRHGHAEDARHERDVLEHGLAWEAA